jgi:hypothetical protein
LPVFSRFRFCSFHDFENPKPLTLRFVLIHSFDKEADEWGLQVAELDWSDYSSTVGQIVHGDHRRHTLLVDRRDNMNFLFYYANSRTGQIELFKWRLNALERRVHRMNDNFQLPINKFNRLDLDNGIICGVSPSLDTISLFDVSRRQLLSEKQLADLPKSIEVHNPRVSWLKRLISIFQF